MALIVTTDYSKKLGLPGFSSHQFSVSIQTELTDLERVPGEVARLYQLLQQSVDREIQQTGFVPGDGYGETQRLLPVDGLNGQNGHPAKGDGTHPEPEWQCSDRQRELLTDLANELKLDAAALDKRSQRLFRRPAYQLNKLCASGLISDLLAEAGTRRQREGRNPGNGNGNGTNGSGSTHAPRNGNGNGHASPAPYRNGGTA